MFLQMVVQEVLVVELLWHQAQVVLVQLIKVFLVKIVLVLTVVEVAVVQVKQVVQMVKDTVVMELLLQSQVLV